MFAATAVRLAVARKQLGFCPNFHGELTLSDYI